MGKNVGDVGKNVGDSARRALKPILMGGAATAAVGGAVALERTLRPKPRKLAGIPVPRPEMNLDTAAKAVVKTGQQAGRIGRQVGKVAADIERAGGTTERIGKLMAK